MSRDFKRFVEIVTLIESINCLGVRYSLIRTLANPLTEEEKRWTYSVLFGKLKPDHFRSNKKTLEKLYSLANYVVEIDNQEIIAISILLARMIKLCRELYV